MFFSKGGRGWEKGVPDGYLSLPEGLRHIFGNCIMLFLKKFDFCEPLGDRNI